MKKLLTIILLFASLFVVAQETDKHYEVVLETSMGNIRLLLYNDTPLHRDNFVKNVREGYYDGTLFHRVIEGFMIQAGDSASRHAEPGQLLGDTKEEYSVPAEIRFPEHCHKRGVLAAAREGDEVNPERASSAFQFYITYGKRMAPDQLDAHLQKVSAKSGVTFPPEVREIYQKKGGVPHLDGQYTVFGEVLEGLYVVKAIQWVETDVNDRPLTDVVILKAYVAAPSE